MRIQRRIFITLVILSIIPMAIIILAFFYHSQQLFNQRILEDIRATVHVQENEIETILKNTAAQTEIIGDSSSLQGYFQALPTGADPKIGASTGFWSRQFKEELIHTAKFFPDFYKLRYIDANGNEIFYLIVDGPHKWHFRSLDVRDNKAKRYFFIEGMKKKDDGIYISPLDLEMDYGKLETPYKPVVRVETPVFDDLSGSKEGIIVITLKMAPVINSLRKPMAGEKILFDEEGNYLNCPDAKKEFAAQLGEDYSAFKDIPGIQAVVNRGMSGEFLDKSNNQWVIWEKINYNPGDLKHYWVIAAVATYDEINALSNGFTRFFFLIFFPLLIIFILTVNRIVRFLADPLIKLTDFVNKISDENLNAKIDDSILRTSSEVGLLARGINNMLERLRYSTTSIDNLKEANLKAQEAEERFRMIVEGVKDYAIFLLDVKGNVVTWNLGAELFKGYKAEEIVGQHFSKFYPEADVAQGKPMQELEIAQKDGVYEERGIRIRKNGKPFWSHVLITALRDKKGHLSGFSKITRDITIEKEREEEIQRLGTFQKAILDNAGSSVISTTVDGKITSFNRSAEQMLGYAAEEMIGKQTPSIIHDKDEVLRRAEEFSKELNELVTPGFETFIVKARLNLPNIHEWTYVRKDGSKFPVLLSVTALRGANNNVFGYVGIATDITKYKHIQKELENQQKALNESCTVSITDTKGTIIYINDKFCELSKFTREELIGNDHRLINAGYHPKEVFKELWSTVSQGKIWRAEVKNKAKDGSFFWNDTTIVPFLDESGKPYQYVTIRTDITESVTAREAIAYKNEELEHANKAALAAAEAKSNFLANMSHEIRTPMNAILGFSNLLSKTELNAKQKSYLDLVTNSGELLLGIINDILDVSKLESGKIQFENIDCDLRKTIFDVMSMIVTRMRNKPFDTYVDIKDDVPMFVKTDPLRLKQVLINLVGNAIKFTTKGEIGVVVEKIGEINDVLELRFIVKDTGVGIPKDKQGKLFQSFSQADDSTTRQYGGTGLGLAISRAIAEGMGGWIWLESEEGQGSQFKFIIKVNKSDKKPEDREILRGMEQLKNKTVFIVDDNLMSQKIIAKCCETLNLQIMGFSSSPHEAFHKLVNLIETRGIVPDIVLSDIMMEGMSGLEMVDKIKADERFKNTSFIAITADFNAEGEFDPDHKIFNAYIVKPISFEGLVSALRSLTESSVSGGSELVEKSCEGIKILVAEDVIANQILIEEYFDQLGCKADIVNNGQEAVNKLKAPHDYDLCFMDVQMPVLDGISAVKLIRKEISKDFPVIALSAAVLKEEQEAAMNAGMTDFVMKPVDFEKLKEKILQYGKLK